MSNNLENCCPWNCS